MIDCEQLCHQRSAMTMELEREHFTSPSTFVTAAKDKCNEQAMPVSWRQTESVRGDPGARMTLLIGCYDVKYSWS